MTLPVVSFQIGTSFCKKCFWVAQRFQRCDKLSIREAALAAEVLMAAPPRGNTGYSVYFITASTAPADTVVSQRTDGAAIPGCALPLSRSQELSAARICGDARSLSSADLTHAQPRTIAATDQGRVLYPAKKELGFAGEIWEKSFYDRRVRGAGDYYNFCIFGKAALSKKVRRRKIPTQWFGPSQRRSRFHSFRTLQNKPTLPIHAFLISADNLFSKSFFGEIQ